MTTRHVLIRGSIAACVLAALAGCANQQASTASAAAATPSSVQVFTATLAGADEVPPVNTSGKGTAEVRVDTKTNELTWKVSFDGLSGPATMAHIHGPAAAGSNAGVVVPFPGVAGQTAASGTAKITQAQYGDLAAGFYYVNVHTAQNPAGEIRGQLKRVQ